MRNIQTPSGPINESSTVILTCDITGGHPLATITWMCEGRHLLIQQEVHQLIQRHLVYN
jgi:hypothetical protein